MICGLFIVLILQIGILGAKAKSLGDESINENSETNRMVHKCLLNPTQQSFNIMPGTGWDNLVNQGLGQVIKFTYNSCKSSNDGKFLLPDNVLIVPIKRSIVILDSETFSHYSNYTSMTSRSINLEINHATPYRQISGSFSYEKSSVKNDQIREKSLVARTQLRYEIYTVSYQPDIELDITFKNRILELGAVIIANEDTLYPKYLADLIVRDFGTHIIRSIDAGAILSKVDVIKSSYASKYNTDNSVLRVTASLSMAKMFGINMAASMTTTTEDLNEYNNNCASIRVHTEGGRLFGSDFTIKEWEKSLEDNLVVVDRRGDPIYDIITPASVQELDKNTLFKVINTIKDAVNRYYEANTRSGCMDMKSPNFDIEANVDSGDCQEPDIKFNFGGIYQSCSGDYELCLEMSQPNPQTGNMSCPQGYDAIQLQKEQYKCQKRCSRYLLVFKDCFSYCSYYELFWCSPNNKPSKGSGFLFGGSFTDFTSNPITNSNTCPQSYIKVKFGVHGMICLTSDKEIGFKNSISFGGFYSCRIGNPLASESYLNYTTNREYWSKSCGQGYSSHLLLIDRTCQISYCGKTSNERFPSEPPIIRPPFIDIGFGPNLTQSSSFSTPYGVVLKLSPDGFWKEESKVADNTGITIGVTILSTISVGFSISGIIFLISKYRFNKSNKVVNGTDMEMMIEAIKTQRSTESQDTIEDNF